MLFIFALLMLSAYGNSVYQQVQVKTVDVVPADSTVAKAEIAGCINELYAAIAHNTEGGTTRFACHTCHATTHAGYRPR